MPTFVEFNSVWDQMAEKGECDSRGGKEYENTLMEWIVSGTPNAIRLFILKRNDYYIYRDLQSREPFTPEWKSLKDHDDLFNRVWPVLAEAYPVGDKIDKYYYIIYSNWQALPERKRHLSIASYIIDALDLLFDRPGWRQTPE